MTPLKHAGSGALKRYIVYIIHSTNIFGGLARCQVASAERATNNTDKYRYLWEVCILLVYFGHEEEKKGIDCRRRAQPKFETDQIVPNARENTSREGLAACNASLNGVLGRIPWWSNG